MLKSMVEVGDIILSDEIFEEHFICDLSKCKGSCCVEGDAGAPLEPEEIEQIKSVLPIIWDDLSKDAQELISKQGISYEDYDGEQVTSIINGKDCVFTYVDDEGVTKCAIEKANREGKTDVRKPISCHLYPIRVQKLRGYTALNYSRWSICKPATVLGKVNGVKIYQFLKEPLVRAYGQEWYDQVCEAAKLLEEEKGK